MGAAALGSLTLSRLPVAAGPFSAADFEKLIPADKKLQPDWVNSLFARGTPARYRWPESRLIGMPVGGICCGQIYLGGDGKLWHWDIFNQVVGTGPGHYATPPQPSSPLDQGFALLLTEAGQSRVRPLDHTGWSDISFRGEYPIGLVDYRDPGTPVTVSLEAFSPFIPLNPEDSALPVTILRFTVKNSGTDPVEAEVGGWLENAVCCHTATPGAGRRRNRVVRQQAYTFLDCTAQAAPRTAPRTQRENIVFEDFEQPSYEGWTAEGTAFGSGPVEQDKMPGYQGQVGAAGQRTVNSHATAPGGDVGAKDAATGTLTSKAFILERDYINFLIGGGGHKGRTCMNLLVNDQAVLSATGRNDNRMSPHTWDVRSWAGQSARLQIVDREPGPWGNIGVDQIVFSDQPAQPAIPLDQQPDFGSIGLALLHDQPPAARPSPLSTPKPHLQNPDPIAACTSLPDNQVPAGIFAKSIAGSDAPVTQPFGQKLRGSLTRRFSLAPGQSSTVTFLLAWHFPNIQLGGLGRYDGRHYGKRFADALAVADYVAAHFDRLSSHTRRWRDTWYDSTLPYWFLDRIMAPTSHLATNTCYWFGNGRFYGWEGVGCCAGTCTHVWHYAQAVARLFPQLERSLREMADFDAGFDPATGRIRFRAEHNNHWAVDGQAGVILRTYREHLMSADDAFLRRVWPRAKKALQFLISQDNDHNGILEGSQHNTLDADWWGPVAWLSGLYLAALRAGEQLALETGDAAFAERCQEILNTGRGRLESQLFNGQYFINQPDPNHPEAINSGTGCHIDQVLGDSWARQVGLHPVLDPAKVRSALNSLWRYNFTPDVGPWRQANKPGRWYALAGEGGLIMCTFPDRNWDYSKAAGRGPNWAAGYFNECMTGFEYQVAWHLLAEDSLLEGLAIARMIHDRYHPARRNPWNEVECGDHYARAMASYGLLLAVSGFHHHGPKAHLAFAPRLAPEQFRCAFTTAEGWGSFSQQVVTGKQQAEITLQWGRLRLETLSLALPANSRFSTVSTRLDGQDQAATLTIQGRQATITFPRRTEMQAGQKLALVLS